MIAAIADTHAAIWFVYGDARLSSAAQSVMERAADEGNNIGVSAITLAEVVYLAEKQRVPASTLPRLLEVLLDPGQSLTGIPIDLDIVVAMQRVKRNEVSDLPDRLIAATALHFGAPIISRDRRIQASGLATIW